MLGLTTNTQTSTNELTINIPDELKGVELQVIILPVAKNKNETIEFFSEEELRKISAMQPGTIINDIEDYSKW